MIDLLLDDNNELVLIDGDLALTSEAEGVKQGVQFSLQLFQGEWFLDESQGIPYFQRILVKNPNLVEVREWFRSAIASSPDISSVEYVQLTPRDDRSLLVTWGANQTTIIGQEVLP